jgi:hypothetical protein
VTTEQILHLHDIGASTDVLTTLIQRSAQLQAQTLPAPTPNPSGPGPASYPEMAATNPPAYLYPDPSSYPSYTYSYLYPDATYPLLPAYNYSYPYGWPYSYSFYYSWPWYRPGYWGGYGPRFYYGRPGFYGGYYGGASGLLWAWRVRPPGRLFPRRIRPRQKRGRAGNSTLAQNQIRSGNPKSEVVALAGHRLGSYEFFVVNPLPIRLALMPFSRQ